MSDLADPHRRARLRRSARRGAVAARPPPRRPLARLLGEARADRVATASLVCGMGGSAIGGDLAAAAMGTRLSQPLDVVRGYGVPSWTPPDRVIFCSSYSGNTEETLACYDAAEAVGAQRIVATTGGAIAEAARRDGVPVIGMPAGLQPRAAVGYTFAIAAEVAALVGAGRRDPDGDRQLRRAPRGRQGLAARAGRGARRADPRLGAAALRLRPDGADRLPLEVPDQRERQAAGLRPPAPGDGPQRDRRLGGRPRGRLHGRLPRGRRPAPARAPAGRAHRRAGRRPTPTTWSGSRRSARAAPSACSGR